MKVTIDHNTIKTWAEKFKGKPELLQNTETETGAVGIRIDFPGKLDDMYLSGDHKPKHISWERFFKIFEDQELALEFEDEARDGDPSNSYHFIRRDNMDAE